MTVIWRQSDSGYERLEPAGFPNEAELHELVASTPELLPLAGSPDLVVLGSEVALGTGYPDVLALEEERPLCPDRGEAGQQLEARRAVVAQLLSYASFLRGATAAGLEEGRACSSPR